MTPCEPDREQDVDHRFMYRSAEVRLCLHFRSVRGQSVHVFLTANWWGASRPVPQFGVLTAGRRTMGHAYDPRLSQSDEEVHNFRSADVVVMASRTRMAIHRTKDRSIFSL